ncbi:AAA family ATPase [Paenibacillus sp. LjRoot56]|uniref:AAA family ATPase n=1 Tax=Paenibacillus sp. LjRoot56 TaxID=3342333 RepID=UPI003ECD183D
MKNILIKGSPGTGKTFFARAMAFYVCHEKLKIDDVFDKDVYSDWDEIEEFIDSKYCEFIQVHPSMGYEDIVYGIEIKASGNLDVSYTEKRIKELCDKANGKSELYCIIFDDICRANSGVLLGNLLYAMEYRNQPYELVDGKTLTIPDNVIFIFTECNHMYGNNLDYALRRRMDYVKELNSDKKILDAYYDDTVNLNTKGNIVNVFESVSNYIERNITKDPGIEWVNYMPGHGMFMVERSGTDYLILDKIKLKLIYQLYPYMSDLHSSGILKGDLEDFFEKIKNLINTGVAKLNNIADIKKILVNSGNIVIPFSMLDSKNYYASTILPSNENYFRDVMECIIDVILLNGIFPYDVTFSSLLTNTDIARVESNTIPTEYASFLVKENRADKFFYESTKNGRRVPHNHYSSEPARKSRWANEEDTIVYSISYNDLTRDNLYLPLNGFRSHNYSINTAKIHPISNSANIYPAVYRLIDSYLRLYEVNISLIMGADKSYIDLRNLISLERKYLRFIHVKVTEFNGDNEKFKYFREKVIKFQTLWNSNYSEIHIDEVKFNELLNEETAFSVDAYEDMYNYVATNKKTIILKGVLKMTDLKEYQKIMENIGVRQMIFQGPPGTSKTFESKKFVLKQLNATAHALTKAFISQEDISADLLQYKLTEADYTNPTASRKLQTGGWDLVQFHPSYGYEDFIRGIEVKAVGGAPSYESVNRILGKIAEFAQMAANSSSGAAPKFYLIIDEINRANLATVFGELIYGLEYRNSSVSTPYEVADKASGTTTKDIVLGKNLFIIGTMNTADKSIDSIDYAIRRRFIFIDSPADRDVVIKCYQNAAGKTDEESIELLLFDAIQEVFEDERFFNNEYRKSDVKLGHTYFLRDRSTGYEEVIIEHFIFQVIPILREYVKDGILDSIEDLISAEYSVADIKAAPDRGNQIKLLGENIMLFVKEFGNANKDGNTINNEYVGGFLENLRKEFKY